MPYGNERILEIEKGSTRSHFLGNSLSKRVWTCGKTDCMMVIVVVVVRTDDELKALRFVLAISWRE